MKAWDKCDFARHPTAGKYRAIILLVGTLLLCIAIHFLLRYIHYPSLALPRSFGIAKNIVDPLTVLIVNWGGWVFGVTWIISRRLGMGIGSQLSIYLVSAVLIGFVQTVVSFGFYDLTKALKGTLTYLFIFGIVFAIFLCISLVAKGIKKCFQ